SMRRWKGWWRLANIEKLAAFAATCIVTIALTSLLAFAVFAGRPDLPNDINFLLVEGQVLSEKLGDWFGTLFWVIGAFSMFGTQVAIMDVLARLSADVIHSGYGRGRSESRVYALTVCALGLFGIAVIALNVAQPLALLILSACLAGFSVVIYAPLLILLNRRLLPRALWPGWPRVLVLVLTTLVFAAASAATIFDQLSRFF
ncbi:MAG TPA: Nramp family divalent metal transporter, partial [Sphingomicrobium sp.]